MAETALKLAKTVKPETRRAKIAAYVRLCTDTGGSASWWNKWCLHVAGRRGSPLKTAEEVSAFHCTAIGV